MSNLFEVLGRYALLVDQTVERVERAEELHREWMMKWYELWGDMQEARSEARYWFNLYNKTTSGERWTMAEIVDGADRTEFRAGEWVPPDAVDI